MLELVCGRLTLGSVLVHQTKKLRTAQTKRIEHKQKAKRAAGIIGQVATMLKSHTRKIDKIDRTAMKRASKKWKKRNNEKETKQKCRLGTASGEITGGFQLVCGRPTLALSVPWFLRPLVVRFAWKIPSS